jgi:hypothetical protein
MAGRKPWQEFAAEIAQRVPDKKRLKSKAEPAGSIEWVPALVALQHTKAPEYIVVRRTVLIGHDDDSEDERKAARAALLTIRWLTPKERSAIMGQLGRSLRKQTAEYNSARAASLVAVIEERKESMKIRGARRRIHDRAYEEIADSQGMEPDNLKKFIQRYGPKGDKRKAIQEKGRQWARRNSGA